MPPSPTPDHLPPTSGGRAGVMLGAGTTGTARAPRPGTGFSGLAVATIAATVAVSASALAVLPGRGGYGEGLVSFAVVSAAVLLTSLVVWLWAVPRALGGPAPGRAGAVASLVAVLVYLPAWWTQVGFVLGASAVWLAARARAQERGRGLAPSRWTVASALLGGLVLAAQVYAVVTDPGLAA